MTAIRFLGGAFLLTVVGMCRYHTMTKAARGGVDVSDIVVADLHAEVTALLGEDPAPGFKKFLAQAMELALREQYVADYVE